MASMVAKACINTSSQMMVPEKGSRNKRKFRADPPISDPSKVVPLPSNDCTSFEFSAEKFDMSPSHSHANGCDMCFANQIGSSDALKLDLGLSCNVGPSEVGANRVREEIAPSSDADWGDLTEAQLEDLVLTNLDTIFRTAVKKIVASGYSEEVANSAILRSGLWYGCKDTVSNIVENTLSFLRSGQEFDPSREHCFEDLQQMEKYILAELVCLLREVRPFFSTGDAMWCLLISDMNVSHACAMDTDPLVSANGSSSVLAQPQFTAVPESSETKISSDSPDSKSKESQISTPVINERPFTTNGVEKFVGSRKLSSVTRREYILRQKSVHFEKHGRPKATSRSGKLSSFGGLVLDKKLKGVANSKKASFKSVGFDAVQENGNHNSNNLSTSNGFSSVPTFGLETVGPTNNNHPHSLPAADTELSLSFPAKVAVANSVPVDNVTHERWVPHDQNDEMLMKLFPRVKELENQLQEWTEWANHKVMQAARRLGKDKAELKTLRQEKEEVERLKKEKQVLEENTMKKLSEMENALFKASRQVERANAAVRRLEVEKGALRREMDVAELCAAESSASCQEVTKRERKALMMLQSSEKQKAIFQEEIAAEKRRLIQQRQKLQEAKDVKNQAEARLNQEENANQELRTHEASIRKEREQLESSAKSRMDSIKSKAKTNMKKYKEDIERLEKEISQLRLKTDSFKIAALKRGIDGSYTNKTTESRNTRALKDYKTSIDLSRNGGVKRERECVMCLSEEMCVVFLPCAHQVVCKMCNEMHEKQGMKDCPSCRSPIQRRVCVRYARS